MQWLLLPKSGQTLNLEEVFTIGEGDQKGTLVVTSSSGATMEVTDKEDVQVLHDARSAMHRATTMMVSRFKNTQPSQTN